MRIKKSDLKTEVSDLRKDEILKKTSPLPQISRKGRAERGCERGSVCKRLPPDLPRPPQEWESEERYLGIEKTVEHGEVLGKSRGSGTERLTTLESLV